MLLDLRGLRSVLEFSAMLIWLGRDASVLESLQKASQTFEVSEVHSRLISIQIS